MNTKSIMALLAIKTETAIGEIDLTELTKNGLIENGKITDKGNQLIKSLKMSCEFFETQYGIKADAKELLEQAKEKYNTFLENMKF